MLVQNMCGGSRRNRGIRITKVLKTFSDGRTDRDYQKNIAVRMSMRGGNMDRWSKGLLRKNVPEEGLWIWWRIVFKEIEIR